MENNTLKEEVLRAFILSQSMEPLGEKAGCTTRTIDSSPGTKLKYFTIAATNSAWSMVCLVDEILEKKGKASCIFKYAYLAQSKSTRNRMGGKVNYAQILLLLPIINAQCILYLEGIDYTNIDLLLDKASQSMVETTIEDVKYLQKFVDLSIEQSVEHNKYIGKKRTQLYPKFGGKYKNIMEATKAENFSHTMIAREIRNGYPQCKRIFHELNGGENLDLIIQSEKIYPKYLKEMKRHDPVADCLVVGFYLTLINKKEEKLFL